MADIRPKDLATTAASLAADDYLTLDGEANGTRKILARSALSSSTHFYARSYGVIEDGSTDNSTALLAMKTAMAANKAAVKSIYFEGGHVRYTDNTWLDNIGSFKLFGNGGKLECRSTNGNYGASQTLFIGSPLYDGATPNAGVRFQSAARNSNTLTFVDADAASAFSAGDRVFVSGYDQQMSGFPPNAKYYEWHEVASVDTGANSITLKSALIYDYDATWPDPVGGNGFQIGAPRVRPLDFGDYYYPELIEFHDVHLVNSGLVSGNPNAAQAVAKTVKWKNFAVDGEFWPMFTQVTRCENGKISSTIELDKLLGRVELIDISASRIENGTSCRFVDIRGGSYLDVRLNSRQAAIRQAVVGVGGGAIQYGLVIPGQYWGSHDIILENNTFVAGASLDHIVNNQPAEWFAADYNSAATQITFDDDALTNGVSHPRKTAHGLDTGVRVYRSSPAESAVVSRIGWDAENSRWVLYFEDEPFSTSIVADEWFYYYTCQKITYRNNRIVGRTGVPAIRYGAGTRQDQIVTDTPSYEDG